MKFVTHGRCIALVLMLFISQTALLIHTTAHSDKDRVKCVLCVCQAQQAHSLPAHNFYITQSQGHYSKPDTTRLLAPVKSPTRSYFQRAPPYIA